MTKFGQTIQRINFLKEFDNYVRDDIGDDDVTEYWLAYGVPDGYSFDDLKEIAEDDNLWLSVVKAFSRCIHAEIEELEEEED